MPTGYTAALCEGDQTLADFAADCARAFGVFIHQRDDRIGTALTYPEAPEHSYYVRSLAEATLEYERWHGLSEAERYAEWSEHYNEALVRWAESNAKRSAVRARLENMKAQILKVEVPSILDNYKDFMISQLDETIRFDGKVDSDFDTSYYKPAEFYDWCEAKDKHVERDITYYADELRKERERHTERVKYIDAMAEAFGFEVAK
jgi:hypothetical protein